MEANGERTSGSAPEKPVKQGDSNQPSNHEEARATYRSFKYVLIASYVILPLSMTLTPLGSRCR
jgi:hypothetical protein